MIFGTSIPKATGHQMAIQFPSSPNICFYTTWGKLNKRNMHWNEQQTSTNWRLDRIKMWSWWSELMKYIVYLLTILLPAIKRVAGDKFVFQQDSAPVHRRAKWSKCWNAKPQILSLRICGPQQPWPQSGRLQALGNHACNSGSIRGRSRMWMNSRSDWLKSGLVWSRTLLTLLPMHAENVCCLCSRKGLTYRTLTVAVEQRDISINCQPEWPKCKPNAIYACYFNKVIILPCIKCNISLVLFPQVV